MNLSMLFGLVLASAQMTFHKLRRPKAPSPKAPRPKAPSGVRVGGAVTQYITEKWTRMVMASMAMVGSLLINDAAN